VLRGATNRVDGADDYWLYFTFDAPGSPGVTELEGVSGGGDSGAPAYLKVGGQLFVAGISSRSRDTNGNGVEPDYGDEDLYTRVSSYGKWITSESGLSKRVHHLKK
jgi:secreted trypsin-like serine protease